MNAPQQPQTLGGPVLAQIRDFVEEAPETAPVNPLAIVLRAVRGQELRILALGSIVGLLLLVLAVLVIQPAYQSSGLVRVLARESKILYADADDSRLRLYDAFVAAEMNILRSRPILEEALLRLRSDPDAPFLAPEDVGRLAELFEVKNNKGLVSVAARAGDPDLAKAALNALLEAYEGADRERHRRQFAVREAELSGRERELEARLATLDARYLEIGGEHDLGTLAKAHVARTAQLQVMDERLDEIENTISQVQTTGASGADVGDIEIQRATLLDNALANMTFERAQRLADMQTLRSRYQPTHPKVRDAEAELGAIESAIAERLDQIATLGKAGALTSSGGGADQSVEDLQRVRTRLLERRATVRADAEELNTRLVQIRSVHEERKRVHELLVETKRALDEVVVESSNDLSGTVEIAAWGARPDGPIEDKRKPLGLGAGMFGGLATLAFVVLATLVTGRLRWSDDLEGRIEAGRLVQVLPEGADDERCRSAGIAVRDGLDLQGLAPGALVALAATEAGVGASRLAGALALAETEARRSVLRLEADALAAAIAAGEGLDELLVQDEVGAGARLLATDCADAPRAPVTLDGLREVLALARRRFDRVVLDLGPLHAGSFTTLVLSLSDAAVLVTARGATGASLEGALERIERHCGDAWLAVFNRALPRDPGLQKR